MSRRHSSRIVRAVAAAVIAGTALAGCSVTVAGVPHAAPQTSAPVITPSAPRTTTPAPPRTSAPNTAAPEDPAMARWMADGWIPRPLLPVEDRSSGTSAWMFGPAEKTSLSSGSSYRAIGAPASVVNTFAVFPVPDGYRADAGKAATATANSTGGRVVDTRPVIVQGYRGLDVRIEFADQQGRPLVGLVRYVEMPRFLVGIESVGLSSDEQVLQEVQSVVAGKLTFSAI
ncbi:hypothetical protein [Pseudonocardia zijingensis]